MRVDFLIANGEFPRVKSAKTYKLDAIDMPTFRPLIAGFLYGTLLLVVAIVIGGGGHGLTLFFMLGGAPITIGSYLLPMRMADFLEVVFAFSVPIFWASIPLASTLRGRWIFLVLIGVHYASSVWFAIVHGRDDFEIPDASEKLRYFLPWIVAVSLVYLLGQILLWRTFVKSSRRPLS